MSVIRHWDGENGASASYLDGRLRIVAEPLMTAGNGRVTVEIDAPWIKELTGGVEALRALHDAAEDYAPSLTATSAHAERWRDAMRRADAIIGGQ